MYILGCLSHFIGRGGNTGGGPNADYHTGLKYGTIGVGWQCYSHAIRAPPEEPTAPLEEYTAGWATALTDGVA